MVLKAVAPQLSHQNLQPNSVVMSRTRVLNIVSALLILLFIYTAVSKLIDFSEFKLQLSKSPFITDYAPVLAWAVPLIEIGVGLLLVVKRIWLLGFYASLFLMSLFTGYIYLMLNYSSQVPCSCGGVLSVMDWHTHLWFNVFFLSISICGVFLANPLNKQPVVKES